MLTRQCQPGARQSSAALRPVAAPRARLLQVRAAGVSSAPPSAAELRAARVEVAQLIRQTSSNPILIRLGWHDAGTFDKGVTGPWPQQGGATGSIRLNPEIQHGANAGLQAAVDLIEPIKQRHPSVSYADLYQMASAVAVELAGGPKIPMRYGRKDVADAAQCAPEGRLPSAGAPYHDGSAAAGDHLRRIFYRMGMNDQEIVALSGAHTLGRARPERSGWGKAETKYTKDGPGKPGGQSWTIEWLKFDNSYFKEVKQQSNGDLLVLPTDAVIFTDDGFRPFAEKYAADEAAFFSEYAVAHAKLSELGVQWAPGAPVTID